MQDSDVDNFTALLRETGKFFRYDITPMTVDIWWNILEPYAYDDVHRAMMTFIRSADAGRFMPKPAEVVRLIDGDSQSNSQRAWALVDRAVRTVGPYRTLVFDDPITMRVIDDMGGWIHLCSHTDEDYTFRANEFGKRYQSYSQLQHLDYHPNKLIGITESSNGESGHGSYREPAKMMGDTAKCRDIFYGGKTQETRTAESKVRQAHFEQLTHQPEPLPLTQLGDGDDENDD